LSVPKIDKSLGIDVYATKTSGIGGVIRQSVDDFAVEEVLVDGSKARIGKPSKNQVSLASPHRQRYLMCVLVKRNWDTLIAIKNIAKQLGIAQDRISIAGIKDAKAVTAQHITIERVSMEDVSNINVKDIEVSAVGYFREKLSAYYLLGNNFNVRVKAINLSKSTVEKRIAGTIKELKAIGGLPNFFGHQRFGTTRAITHVVGKAIVRGNFEEAAMLFLAQPSAYEHPSSRRARRELQSKQNFKQALRNFPRQLRYERLMLSHLVEKPRDFIGAFKLLPVKLQELFVQAYQSYLFNRFLCERIRNGFSLNTAEIGDYIMNLERSGLPIVRTGRTAGTNALSETNQSIKLGRMQVAIPLVGVKQRLSQGVMGQIEKKILETEDVETENFRIDAIPEMSRGGELRSITTPIENFESRYASSNLDNLTEHQIELEFMLLRGSYATVLLREIMKPCNPISAGF